MSTNNDGKKKNRRERLATTAGTIVLAIGIVHALANFRDLTAIPPGDLDGLWERLILSPPLVLSTRAAILLFGYFVIASIVSHAIQGRWLLKLGPQGGEVDPASDLERVSNVLEELDQRLRAVENANQTLLSTLASLVNTISVRDAAAMESGDGESFGSEERKEE